MNKWLWVLVIIIILGGGYWWWSSQQSAAPEGAQSPSESAGINGSPDQGNLGQPATGSVQQPGDGTSVSQNLALGLDANASVGGAYLIGYNGMTLYTYAKDTAGVSNCSGTCAQNWPPYTVPAGSTLNKQAGVSGAIGTIAREDGSMQVTYKGMPLYFYIGDKSGSDVNGQGIGGVWYVVKP